MQTAIQRIEQEKQDADAKVADAERATNAQSGNKVSHSTQQFASSVKETAKPDYVVVSDSAQPWSPGLVMTMGLGFLVFALIVLGLMTWTMRQLRNHKSILRAFGLLLIISAAVLLVIVGYGERQLAPVLGLLGTIAGYLLGRSSDASTATQHQVSQSANDKPGA